MIHEVLLALSGHPSDLFIDPPASSPQQVKVAPLPLLSPPEGELLCSVGRKAYLHRQIRTAADDVAKLHSSTVCRAVAAAIKARHLAQFQEKILCVERSVLKKDASIVGAYNIVPLAGIVAEFDDWTRRLEWLWDIVQFIQKPHTTGAMTIDKLRNEAMTGYSDVEEVAVDLGRVADRAWLQQLSSWILYGRLPHRYAAADFFIHGERGQADAPQEFHVAKSLYPRFVSPATAASILFIGKTLNLAQAHRITTGQGTQDFRAVQNRLVTEHIKFLNSLSNGITETSLSEAVLKIRQSLSSNLLRQLLPLDRILELLDIFRQFFLLDRGEFATALVEEADLKAKARKSNTDSAASMRDALRGILFKEVEVKDILSRTWSHLLNSFDDDDDSLDLARRLLHLTLSNPYARERSQKNPNSTVFHDFLLSVPCHLVIDCPPPLDLFIAPSELETYSSVHSYLIAVRRAHMHLSGLWRESRLRRPSGPLSINPGEERSVWATCRSALFFLSETGAYFSGEIVQASWKHFLDWVKQGDHDPEQLSTAHNAFLHALHHYLLLNDTVFVASLQRFLRHVDATVGILLRLQLSSADILGDRTDMILELGRSRKRLDSEMKALMSRLRNIDSERGSTAPVLLSPATSAATVQEEGHFEPKRCGGVDRLLMKLDFGAEMEGDDEDGSVNPLL